MKHRGLLVFDRVPGQHFPDFALSNLEQGEAAPNLDQGFTAGIFSARAFAFSVMSFPTSRAIGRTNSLAAVPGVGSMRWRS
jgi:hypothetical protein